MYNLVQNIETRHNILIRSIGTRSEENYSYHTAQTLQQTITICLVIFSLLEMASYFVYNNMVSLLSSPYLWTEIVIPSFTLGSKLWKKLKRKHILEQKQVKHEHFIQSSAPYKLIWAIVGPNLSIVGIYGRFSIVARYCVTLWSHSLTRRNKKPVTFEPFQPKKRQSAKNDSTLHQKPICTIR